MRDEERGKRDDLLTFVKDDLYFQRLKNCLTVPTLRSGFRPASQSSTRPQDSLITNIINGLSLRTPWKSTCLVKALAAQKMFSKRHIPHSIHFGVKKNDSGKLEAHAWVSVHGTVVIGGESLGEFVELTGDRR